MPETTFGPEEIAVMLRQSPSSASRPPRACGSSSLARRSWRPCRAFPPWACTCRWACRSSRPRSTSLVQGRSSVTTCAGCTPHASRRRLAGTARWWNRGTALLTSGAFFSASVSLPGRPLLQLLLLHGRLLLLAAQLALDRLQVLLQRLAFLLRQALAVPAAPCSSLSVFLSCLFDACGGLPPRSRFDVFLGERLAGGGTRRRQLPRQPQRRHSSAGSRRGIVLTLEASRPRTDRYRDLNMRTFLSPEQDNTQTHPPSSVSAASDPAIAPVKGSQGTRPAQS